MRVSIRLKTYQYSVLTIISFLLACYCVIWFINPISSNIYMLGICLLIWYNIAFIMNSKTIGRLLFGFKSIYIWTWPLVMLIYSLFEHMKFSLSYFVYIMIGFIVPYYILTDKKWCVRYISIIGIGYCIIICIMSNIAYRAYPSISRVLSYGSEDMIRAQGGLSYRTPFIAGYRNIYLLIFLVLTIIGVLKFVKKKLVCLILLLTGLLFVCTIVKAQFTIALILLTIGIIGFVAYNQKNMNKKAVSCMIVIFIGLIFFVFLQQILSFIADIIGGNISIHLHDLMGTLNGNMGVLTSDRMTVYMISLKSIISHPLIGVGTLDEMYISVGFHSSILDSFARFGLIGGISYITTLIIPYQTNLDVIPIDYQRIYKWVFIVFIASSFFNVMFNYQILCTIYILIPGLVCIMTEKSISKDSLEEKKYYGSSYFSC